MVKDTVNLWIHLYTYSMLTDKIRIYTMLTRALPVLLGGTLIRLECFDRIDKNISSYSYKQINTIYL